MDAPEVTFAESTRGLSHDGRISWALGQIPADGWPKAVRQIEVTRSFDGGLSGALVVQAVCHDGDHRSIRVIKFDSVAELARESAAYTSLIKPRANALFAPIVAVTPNVLAPDTAVAWADFGAVVYGEASDNAGSPGDPVRTLEEFAAAARADPTRVRTAVEAIDRALTGVVSALHSDCVPERNHSSLRALNKTLGPNLRLAVDRRDDRGQLVLGQPDLTAMKSAWRTEDQVLARSLTGGRHDFRPGEAVSLHGLVVTSTRPLILTGHVVTVEIDGDVAATIGETLSVHGVVTQSRGAERRARLEEAFSSVADRWTADPFAALPDTLTETAPNRVRSVVHGDLNARNILFVRDLPCVIDYARATADRPQQTDFGWLEIALLRDVFADAAFGELVRLQRVLAVGSRLLCLKATAQEAARICLGLLDDAPPDVTAAFAMLFAIRVRAFGCYPDWAGPVWWRDHLQHLLLSAHRTLKWSEAVQTDTKLRAVAAAASVATEWLTDGNPLQDWDSALVVLRGRLVRAGGAEQAKSLIIELHQRHDEYVELRADVVGAAEAIPVPVRAPVVERDAPTAISLISVAPAVVLTGEPGSGKTRVVGELAYLLARRVFDGPVRGPVLVRAADLARVLPAIDRESLALGAVHLLVDDLDEVDPETRHAISAQLAELRTRFPLVPVLLACRTTDGTPTGFREIRLRALDADAVPAYLYRNLPPGLDVDRLLAMLDDPDWAWLDIHNMGTLSQLVSYIAANGMPTSPDAVLRQTVGTATGNVVQIAQQASVLWEHPRLSIARAHEARWRDALLLFVTRPVPREVLVALVAKVSEKDVRLVGALLRAAADPPADLLRRFVTAQRDVLRDPRGDKLAWHASAGALEELGNATALADVVTDSSADDEGRRIALGSLLFLHERAHTATATLARAVHQVLLAPAGPDLLEASFTAIRRARLRGLELHVAAHVGPEQPWPVAGQAAAALQELGVVLPESTNRAFQQSCLGRLVALDATLRGTTVARIVRAIQAERVELLPLLADDDRRTWLSRLRFAFGIADEVGRLYDREIPPTTEDVDRLLDLVADGTPAEAVEAAHRLLRDPDRGTEVLARTGDDPSGDRLLIAAAAVRPDNAPTAERLFRRLLPAVEADRLEGFAALLCAIFTVDRPRGVRLAWTAARTLAERDLAERHHWPWTTALARTRGSYADLDVLLCGADESVPLAVEALASYDLLVVGRQRRDYRFSDRGRARLLRGQPEPGSPPGVIIRWVTAAAVVGLVEALPAIRALADDPGIRTAVSTRSWNRRGVVEQPAVDEVRAAIALLSEVDEA